MLPISLSKMLLRLKLNLVLSLAQIRSKRRWISEYYVESAIEANFIRGPIRLESERSQDFEKCTLWPMRVGDSTWFYRKLVYTKWYVYLCPCFRGMNNALTRVRSDVPTYVLYCLIFEFWMIKENVQKNACLVFPHFYFELVWNLSCIQRNQQYTVWNWEVHRWKKTSRFNIYAQF